MPPATRDSGTPTVPTAAGILAKTQVAPSMASWKTTLPVAPSSPVATARVISHR